jgi:tetratricopeptide (TPR) repeat protein
VIQFGERLARQGAYKPAIALFKRAIELEPEMQLDPETYAKNLAAPYYVRQGERLAKNGYVDSAISHFKEALNLDSALELDLKRRVQVLAASHFLEKGKWLAQAGYFESAVADKKGSNLRLKKGSNEKGVKSKKGVKSTFDF